MVNNKISGAFLMLLFLAFTLSCSPDRKLSKAEKYLSQRENTQNSIILIKNELGLLPLKKLNKLNIAKLTVGNNNYTAFAERLNKYTKIEHFKLNINAEKTEIDTLEKQLQKFNLIIIDAYFKSSALSEPVSENVLEFISGLKQKKVLVLLAENENLNKFSNLVNFESILLARKDKELNGQLAAEIIFGASRAKGKLETDLNKNFPEATGIQLNNKIRLSYTIPEASGLDSKLLTKKIDSIARLGINEGAFPGCQVLIAKDMKLVFHKTYGYHTYNNELPVKTTDIYDLASVTKISASTLALMKLYDLQKFKLDDKFSDTWKAWQKTNKDTLTWREILAHQAALKPWIPYWFKTINKFGNYKKKYYNKDSSDKYSIKLKDDLFLRSDFKKTVIFKQINESKLIDSAKYLYSGLTFYLYPQIVQDLSGTEFSEFLYNNFYKPLGAEEMKFNAYKHFPLKRIIPTEKDTFFRKMQIHGVVHDEGAALMGGISGNAGLFSTADDLAKLMQMLVNYGNYGGEQLLKDETVKKFTKIQFPENDNRRGLGFDKPKIGNDTLELKNAYPAPSCSKASFGHSGYTGTFVWADPKENIVFIFLSNRVFPTRENSNIYKLNIRPAMHQAIYDAIK